MCQVILSIPWVPSQVYVLRILNFILLAQIFLLSSRPINPIAILWKSSWIFQRLFKPNRSQTDLIIFTFNWNISSVNGTTIHLTATIYLMENWTSSQQSSLPYSSQLIFTTSALLQAIIFYWDYCNGVFIGFPIHRSD